MNFNRDLGFEFTDRFHRNQHVSNSPRFSSNYRGRGHQRGYFRGRKRGSHFTHNYRQLVNDFNHQSISSSISQTNEKPKYETIILELGQNSDKLSEETLSQHFQKTYGTIKKIWFNNTRSNAFITFYNHMSVDMCLESGNCVQINGLSVKVRPLLLTIAPELLSSNEDISFQLKTLCKSNNKNLKAMFPTKEGSDQRHQQMSTLSRKQLLNLVQIEKIDEKKLLDDILGAKDIKQQMNILFDTLLLNDSDLEKRTQLKDYLQELLNSNGFECRLHFFGSTVNGLGFRDSDIDIFIDRFDGKQRSFDETMTSLKIIHSILKRTLKMFIPNPIPSHRCPIVRLVFSEMPFMKDSGNKLVCDLNLSNGLGVRNSHLIRHFCRLEPRFQQLCLLLRFWAKINNFLGSWHMSSYAFTQLVVFFCQKEGLLPTVDHLRQVSKTEEIVINGWDTSFSEDTQVFSDNQRNNDSILQLLEKFFAFYANFDFNHQIIRTKTGLTQHKLEVWQQMDSTSEGEASDVPKESFRLTPVLSIEDPFELTHNLCANLNYFDKIQTFNKFCDYLIHISRDFRQIFNNNCEENPSIEEATEDKSKTVFWGFSPLCREWDPTPNGYAFPEHYIGFANLDLILSADSSQTPKDLMQLMANRLIDLTDIWLSKVYRMECLLLSKWHLISGQLSPFAEFYVKVRALDNRSTDSTTRQEFRQQFTEEELKELSFTEIETQITDRIHRKFDGDVNNANVVPTECHFALVMNCRTSFPTLELVLIDLKPGFESTKAMMNFLRRMIATAANDSRLLTCPQELIS